MTTTGVCGVCHFEGRVEVFDWGESLCAICAKTPVSLDASTRATVAWVVRLLKGVKR